jgi:ankyrin repeat protein
MAKEAWHNTPLQRAAANGTPATIQALRAAGTSVSAKNAKGQTPLPKTADLSTSENIKTLLSAGADVMVQTSWCKIVWGTLRHTSLLHA